MAVFRVEKNKNYTVMSNHHLKDKTLTLKSKGLLSVVLSLPDEWNYTTRGLAAICKEGVDCIGAALRELEAVGYLERNQLRDEKGRITDTEYIIYESPQDKPPKLPTDPPSGNPPKNPITDSPDTPLPHTASPHTENPYMDEPDTEMSAQLNTNINKSLNALNPYVLNTDSIPSLSPPPQRKPVENPMRERKGTEADISKYTVYREIIHENLEYDHMIENNKYDRERIDEIVDLMLETVCTSKKTVRIASDDYPAELVKSKFLKLNSLHLDFVLDCMKKNTTDIRNIKKYLLAVLFNAPSTIDSYYTSLVSHDMANGLLARKTQ
jgi:hypothetical protein